MFSTHEVKRKKIGLRTLLIFISLILLIAMVAGNVTPKEECAHATDYDFEIYFLLDGASQVDLGAELESKIQYDSFLLVEMYIKALSAESYEVAVMEGSLYLDKTFFTLPEESFDTSVSITQQERTTPPFGTIDVQNWPEYWLVEYPGYDNLIRVGLQANTSLPGGNVVIDQSGLLIAQMWIQVDPSNLPTESTEITWDFNDEYDPGKAVFAKRLGANNYHHYCTMDENDAYIIDDSNILFTPLTLGDPAGSQPSDELTELSLTENQGGATEYIKESFSPLTTDYTTWQISYANSVNGMLLNYRKASNSAEVTVSFSSGSAASIDANNVITGLADGDEIIIDVSDEGGLLQKTYTIVASVAAASSNADLSSLTAKSGMTPHSFEEIFDADTLSYTLNIPYRFTEVTLTATAADPLSIIYIDTVAVASRTFNNIAVGTLTKDIVVVAEDSTIKTYSVTIIRAEASKETGIASILINGNSVEITEGINEFNYTLAESAGNYVFSIIGKEPYLQKIEYQVEGSDIYTTMPAGGNSGSPRTIAKDESVQVNIRVTAEDASQIENYTLIIARAPSTNNALSRVSIQEGDTTKTLTPEGTVYTYTIAATGADFLTVTAEGMLGENSTVTIFDTSMNEAVDGIISIDNILPGTYEYTIKVFPQDVHAPVGTYTLKIIKKSDAKMLFEPIVKHTNNFDELIEGFSYNESTFTYTLNISYQLNDIVVNDIRIEFRGSEFSALTSPSWANFTQGAPVSNQPTAYADISFNNSTALVAINRDVYVTAQDGSVQRYNIKINRAAADSDNTLSFLTVAGNSVDGFSPNTFIYNTPIILPGDTLSVNVYGEPNSENATVTYNDSSSGQIPLTRGELTTINIKVIAQNGAAKTYTIKVIAANTDNTISNIVLKDGQSQIISGLSFDPLNSGPYVLNVPYPINVVTIEVTTPSGALSMVYGAGTQSLSVSTNTFTVYAVSEAGIKGEEYIINITRNAARTDKYLETLTISSAGTNPVPNYITDFNSSNTEYDIRVNRNVASLKVDATVPVDNGSRITSGLTESYTWMGMSTTIQIEVTAEDNSKRIYKVNVTRANDIYEIVDIELDVQETNYSAAVTNYDLTPVAYATTTINFNVTLLDSFSNLYIKVNSAPYTLQNDPTSVIVTLSVGQNTISMYVVSEYGTQGSTYKFNIERRVPNTNAKLSSLEVIAGGSNILVGTNAFDPNTPLYEVRVNNNITSITIDATLQDSNATLSISPAGRTLNSGLNTFYITVTAEDNVAQLTYEVRITRANDIYDINDIEVDLQTIEFDQSTIAYALSAVSYAVDTAVFNVTLADSFAKLYVRVNSASKRLEENPESVQINLIQGLNTIRIYAESEFGTQGTTYVFTVTRNAPNTNAKLSDLEVIADGSNLLVGDKAFDATTTLYELRVDNTVSSITINATAQDDRATFAVTPSNLNLNNGLNTFFVTVTAEDEVTKLVYELRITKANDINAINDIEVDLQTITFDASTTAYSLDNVPFATSAAIFSVSLADTSAKLYVKVNTGSPKLQDTPESVEVSLISGTNTIYIYAVSEFGTQGTTYVFTVIRNAASANAKLGTLEILAGSNNLLTGDNAFDADITLYEMRVDNDIASVTINAEPADSKARLSITPTSRALSSGQNSFYITVTAEDNIAVLTYTIKITRANDICDIENIEIDLQTISFDPSTTEYALDSVISAIQTAIFNVTLADTSAKLYVRVNAGAARLVQEPQSIEVNLVTGVNTIRLQAISEYGTEGDIYTFTVTRQTASTNAKLASLEIIADGKNIIEGFDPDIALYNIRVDHDITDIIINAVAADSRAKLSITPTSRALELGLNNYYIRVTAEDNINELEYTIKITRANNINEILDIEVNVEEITFSQENYLYQLSAVAFSVKTITFNVTLQDTYSKLYIKKNSASAQQQLNPESFYITLDAGQNNIQIYAVSEYGEQGNIYTFTITQNAANNDASLSSLEVLASGSNLLIGGNAFDPETKEYNVRVNNNITAVTINAVASDSNAIVSKSPSSGNLINNSKNIFYINITAESGITDTYTVNVFRANDNNTILELRVNGTPIQLVPYVPVILQDFHNSVQSINISATLEDASATLYGTGSKSLVEGAQLFEVYAISQYGILTGQSKDDVPVYIIQATRKPLSNDNKLEGLTVADMEDNILPFDSGISFDPLRYTYQITLPDISEITAVKINAVAQNNNKTVSGDIGIQNLTVLGNGTINSQFVITVRAENNATQNYTINILKGTSLSNDASISSVTLKDAQGNEYLTFNSAVAKQQDVNIPYSVSGLTLTVTPNHTNASVSGTYGYINVNAGSSAYVEFKVVAQDGTESLTYNFSIIRAAAKTENHLESLIIKDENDLSVDFLAGLFNAGKTTYDIRVDDTVESVVINAAVPANNGSFIINEILPSYSLVSGATKTIFIMVQAENGSTNIYTLNIKRANNDNSIASIKIGELIVPVGEFTYVASSYEYTVSPNFIYGISTVEIEVMLENPQSKATITGAGVKNLSVGNNAFIVYATAQDGTVGDNYVIRITREAASNDNSLQSLLITTNLEEILLDEQSGIKNTYNLQANRAVTSATINAVANHAGAKVNGDIGTVELSGGTINVLKIYVTAENNTVKTYTINIDIKDDNNEITNITSNLAQVNYQADTYIYDLGEVPYVNDAITFGFELSSQYAKLYVNGVLVANLAACSHNLAEGVNTFVVYAESERGSAGQNYTLTITRTAADANNYLSNLSVLGGVNELPFVEGAFNKELAEYTVILDSASSLTYIEILATAENGSQPQGTGIKQLKEVAGVISNLFVVSVVAENGNVRNYSITVIKSSSTEISDDNSISDISLIGNGQEFLKNNFNPEVSVQDAVTVPFNVNAVYLAITAHKNASITGAGMYDIDEGQTITIQFQVTAENGSAGLLYKVDVTREIASSNNTLEELYYEIDGEKTYIDPSIDEHTINIDYTATNIVISGQAPNNAIVSGFGDFNLTSSSMTKVITVTAQNGAVRTYVLTILKQSDDASIKSILLDSVNIFNDFVAYVYQTNVPYSKSTVNVIATPNNSNAVIYGNGTHNLNVGLNTIEIYAESEAGTLGQTYTINITRQAANTNNNLASLVVKDAATFDALLLQPVFSSGTTNYVIDITSFPKVQEIIIEAAAESSKAKSVTGMGTFILKTAAGESSEIFTVTVTAEDDSKKNYNITVIRNVNPDDDVTVHSLSLIGNNSVNYFGTASNALQKFELSKKSYNIIVPYKVNNATLTVTNNNGANVYGNGNYVLSYQSDTIIEFYLDSKSGNHSSDRYVLVVTREQPSNVNTLSSLTVDGVLIEGFDPEITSYEMTVSYEEISSVVIGATPTHQEANVIGDLGNINLSAGLNTINITVRAEDNSTKTYSIIISRLSTDNTLIHLGVTNYSISPAFDKEIYEYTLNVPYTVEMVNVEAIANSTATITGAGHKSLQIGENTIDVFVTSEQGQAGQVYEIIINRAQPSTDNTLKDLSVLSGVDESMLVLKPTFKPEVSNYIIQLEENSDINTLYIFAEANCPYAKGVGGTGYKVLTTTVDGQYHNVFEIIVMAQDNTTKVYTVSVYRNVELADDVTITELSLIGSNGINYLGGGTDALSKFSPNIYTYNIVVPYYVESITLAIQTLSASVYGTGQEMFDANNRVTFNAYLVSQSGDVTSNTYTINVNRIFASENNLLDFIKVNGQNIEGFDADIMTYEIDIPYQTTNKIIISAQPKSSNAIILSGIGTFDLKEGRNVFSILVKAENGDTKSYNLVVNYMNNNSLLETLNIQGSMEDYVDDNNYIAYPFTFICDTFNYIVTVDKNIKTVVLKGAASDQERAAIIGLGKYTLNDDRTTITINVIAADNTTTSTYKVDIVKTVMPSTNTRLKDLQVGGYSLGFRPDNHSYTLTVGSNIEYLDISAIPEDPNAKTTIIGNDYLGVGNNVILVQVESEDGSIAYYQLSVKKNMEQDYFLTVLLILIFLLMLLAFLYKIMSNNNKNITPRKEFKKFKLNGNNNDDELIDLNNIGKEAKKWQT